MASPVLAEVTRGAVVESRHHGSVVVCDASGTVVFSLGDPDRPTFPRSAVKALQALPLVESGAADRFGFGHAELALAMASHNGEQRHIDTVRTMLKAAGVTETCLECGPQWPERGKDQARLHRMGAPAGRIHNNCSGKHAGFICSAVAMGIDPAGYVRPDHALMREVVAAMEAMTGVRHGDDIRGTDGCSIPTYAIPLRSVAHAFARFATGEGLGPVRRAAAERLRAAAAAEPFMTAGSGRFCTRAMTLLGRRAYVKTGAEGVFAAALPDEGLGIAIKIDDGAARASEVVIAELLRRHLSDLGDGVAVGLDGLTRQPIADRNGAVVGEIRQAVPAE